jgi:hypothetical protein
MREEPEQPRNLKELREELLALARLSSVTMTEIARIQRRIRELSAQLSEPGSKKPPTTEGENPSHV